MNDKLIYYQNLAAKTVNEIYSGSDYWMTFLNTASKIYKYSFVDQILIHAQMPEATACAEYRIWNDTMHRYIKKGSHGIALLTETDAGIGLRYVYDISCTGTRKSSRNVDAFVYRSVHESTVFSVLPDGNSLEERLFSCAKYLLSENYNENISQSADLLDKSDEIRYNKDTEETMLNFAAASAAYMAMHRMGQTSEICRQLLMTADYAALSDPIKLGNSISKVGGTILRQMEFLCKTYDKEHTNAQEEMHHENNEHRSEEHTDRPSRNDGTERDHLPTGGRRVSAADRRGRQPDEAPGQVGTDAPDVPEGTQIGDIQRDASDGNADAAPVGDRGKSADDVRESDDVFGETEQRDGESESFGSDEVDRNDEQPAGNSRGDDSDGADLQLTDEPSEVELNPSETGLPAPTAGIQLNLFDEAIYEAEQIAYIDEAESKPSLPFAFHFSQEIIDTVLKYGGNERDTRMRITAEFMKDKTVEEHGVFLRNFFHGGNGFKIDNREICGWYDEDGIRLARGRSARYIHDSAVQIVSWIDAAVRIEELLLQGQFASNVEITEAAGHERLLLSEKLLYLHRDIREDVRDHYFSEVMFAGGFPEARERNAEMLADPLMLQTITEELERFADDYRGDRTLLRFNYHRVDELVVSFRELSMMNRTFSSELPEMPKSEQFITEDELNEAFTSHGSGVEGCKSRIYNYFMTERDTKERIAFLKKEYGIGGHSHALSNAGGSDEMHDGKGIAYKKDNCADVQISWPNVEKRISELIRCDRYLNPSEKAAYAALRSVGEVYNTVKEEHPDDIVLYQVGDFFEIYGEDAKLAADKLELYKTTRNLPSIGRVDMCGFPANRLEERAEKLREEYPITIIAYDDDTHERKVLSMQVYKSQTDVTVFDTPEGITYQVGTVFSGMLNNSVIYARIDAVDDNDVYYTILDYPDIGSLEMSRDQFDNNLDNYVFQIRDDEQEEQNYDIDSTIAVIKPEPMQAISATEQEKPIVKELFEQYKLFVGNALIIDAAYVNACRNSDRENAFIEGAATIKRIVTESGNLQLIKLYFDMPTFHNRLHQELLDETYSVLATMVTPSLYKVTQADIDEALQKWNGNIESKRAVVRYMKEHGQEKDTAAWLAQEYGMGDTTMPLQISVGNSEPAIMQWEKVQIRIAQLIKEDKFYTEAEYDRLDDIDPVAVRETLARRGIVNGELVDPEKLEYDPFISQVMADAAQIAEASENHNEIDHVNALLSAMKMDDVSVSWENDTIVARDDNNIWRGQELYEFLLNEALTLDENFHPVQGQDVPQDIVEAVLEDAMKYDAVIQTVTQEESKIPNFPYDVGDSIYLEDGNEYIVESIGDMDIHLRDPRQTYPILRAESKERMAQLLEQYPQEKREPIAIAPPPENFRITDDHIGEGGAKTKFRRNMDAINTLKAIEAENRYATPEEQEILAQYIGWGGLADAFDDSKEHWQKEFLELYDTLEPKEWTDAKSSTLNAHYTSPVVIRAMYEVLANMGFTSGNILEPAMGIGNFFGMLPSEMNGSKLYGVELDSLSGRIAKQLYPNADITIAGFETTDRRDFYDVAIGNVPFGNYKVNDKAYNKLNFSIHDYFIGATRS